MEIIGITFIGLAVLATILVVLIRISDKKTNHLNK